MKKIISLISMFVLLLVSSHSFAQIKFGVIGGLNLASMTGAPSGYTIKMVPSYHIGGFGEYSVNEAFAIQAGVLISGKGVKAEFSEAIMGQTITGTLTGNVLNLEIPVNAVYKIALGSAKLHLFAGPYLGYGLSGTYKVEASLIPTITKDVKFGSDKDSDLKAIDFGLNIGAGIEISNFLIRAQYGLGLTNLEPKAGESETKNKVIGISLGYMFGGK